MRHPRPKISPIGCILSDSMALVVLEIAWLLWSHPILTGLVILLFTTPLFHIVLFFTPLLVSTALCVIALVSIGPQIEKIREERQFKMSLLRSPAATPAPEPRPANRLVSIRQGRPQRPPMRLAGPGAGHRRWSDWVRGVEFNGQTIFLSESHLMGEISEEGLKSEPGEGIPMVAEDFHLGFQACSALSQRKLRGGELPQLPAGEGGVTAGFDDEVMLAMAATADRDRLMRLVPVPEEESTAPRPGLFPPSDARFMLATADAGSKEKRRKKMPWFRRRRIPCISKALGKLRDRICTQLRRIFT